MPGGKAVHAAWSFVLSRKHRWEAMVVRSPQSAVPGTDVKLPLSPSPPLAGASPRGGARLVTGGLDGAPDLLVLSPPPPGGDGVLAREPRKDGADWTRPPTSSLFRRLPREASGVLARGPRKGGAVGSCRVVVGKGVLVTALYPPGRETTGLGRGLMRWLLCNPCRRPWVRTGRLLEGWGTGREPGFLVG